MMNNPIVSRNNLIFYLSVLVLLFQYKSRIHPIGQIEYIAFSIFDHCKV